MARYDVHRNPDGGYLLDVQADILDILTTRIVVPLVHFEEAPRPAQRLNPVFEIGGKRFIMTTQFLAAVPATILAPPVDNFLRHHDEIVAALDMAFHGF